MLVGCTPFKAPCLLKSRCSFSLGVLILILAAYCRAQTGTVPLRSISGVVMTDKNEVVPNVAVAAEYASGKTETTTNAIGSFRLNIPSEEAKLKVLGEYLVSEEK